MNIEEEAVEAEATAGASDDTAGESGNSSTEVIAEAEDTGVKEERDSTNDNKEKEIDETLGSPDKYEFIKIDDIELSTEFSDAYSEVAKELNLSQKSADKILSKVVPVLQQKALADKERINTEWAEATKADKDIGGNNLDGTIKHAKKALDSFASKELKTLLDNTGLGNHPEVIRLMSNIGKSISEDGYIGGKSKSTAAKPHVPNDFNTMASVLYPQK